MDDTTISRGFGSCSGERHIAARSTEPLASSLSFSSGSFNLPATPPNSSSFDSRVTVLDTETGWQPLTADSAYYVHAPAGQQNNTRPDRGGDWGMARWKSRPHRWWERDQEIRRQQLRDVEAKQAAFAMLSREADEDDVRRPGMRKVYVHTPNELLRNAQERAHLTEWMRMVERAIAYHGAQRKHYSDIIRHAIQSTPYDWRKIERAGIQRDLHHDDFIHASRELAFAKQEYEDIEKAEKRGRTMTVRRDLCKPREVSTPVSETSPRDPAAGVSKLDVPVTDREDDFLKATCVVS